MRLQSLHLNRFGMLGTGVLRCHVDSLEISCFSKCDNVKFFKTKAVQAVVLVKGLRPISQSPYYDICIWVSNPIEVVVSRMLSMFVPFKGTQWS